MSFTDLSGEPIAPLQAIFQVGGRKAWLYRTGRWLTNGQGWIVGLEWAWSTGWIHLSLPGIHPFGRHHQPGTSLKWASDTSCGFAEKPPEWQRNCVFMGVLEGRGKLGQNSKFPEWPVAFSFCPRTPPRAWAFSSFSFRELCLKESLMISSRFAKVLLKCVKTRLCFQGHFRNRFWKNLGWPL